MASRTPAEPQSRPEPGQILIVIHDFFARSSDELSLSKGDRVELIERDDEFGDGWFLGRHLMTGSSGLFPEVYTRIAPRGPPSYPTTSSMTPRSTPLQFDPPKTQPLKAVTNTTEEAAVTSAPTIQSSSSTEADRTPQGSRHVSASAMAVTPNIPSTSNITSNGHNSEGAIVTPSVIARIEAALQPKSLMTAVKTSSTHGQDSPVMNETLSVIDEHITDMNSPHQSVAGVDRRGGNDSGSEYSSHADQRMSYINGEETDEEGDTIHTRPEVESWSADQVAEYLFTAGVEAHHCEVFRDQDITGDVLLGMDQTTLQLKEFDLGTLGRRLKTWHKIKLLQDEVTYPVHTRTNTASYGGSEVGSEDGSRNRSRSTNSATMLPRIPSINEHQGSTPNSRLSQQQTPRIEQAPNNTLASPTANEAVRPTGDRRRPSAASIRDMHHSRLSSANEFSTGSLMGALARDDAGSSLKPQDANHKKQPSFDRNWTMGSAASPSHPSRPLSSSGLKDFTSGQAGQSSPSVLPNPTFDPLDRGYFSGGEAEGRSRNVLRKRGSTATATHSRNSSYTDEQRLRSATAHSRHSRFGSVDSIRDSAPPSAAAKYYGLSVSGRRRTPSETSINAPPRPMPPPKDFPSPTVTKLQGLPYETAMSPTSPNSKPDRDWLSPVKQAATPQFGLRATSDAVTGSEKSRLVSPTESMPSSKESPMQSPSRTGSSSPSAGPSFELDSPNAKSTTTITTPGSTRVTSNSSKKKGKKETSAYTRGLERKTPQEQMIGADYSGWMKKKSTNLMTTWKPRLFILKGRRLSYYYSEDDQEEKGLIDISFHRVLPADDDRLTGLHATLTGATYSPTSPSNAHTPTIAATEAAAEPESSFSKGSDSMFIFKLVPPRAGLSKAVTFTKPTVHYFAVPNIKQGRLWMAALMKATIDRDETITHKSTYQQKTISLAKARAMRHRPPALMNLDEKIDEEMMLKTPASDRNGLNISGIVYDREPQEGDSGVSGVSKAGAHPRTSNGTFLDTDGGDETLEPRTA